MKIQVINPNTSRAGKTTSKYKTYRLPEGKAFSGMFEKFGRIDREHKRKEVSE
jgi:hypothetical protein